MGNVCIYVYARNLSALLASHSLPMIVYIIMFHLTTWVLSLFTAQPRPLPLYARVSLLIKAQDEVGLSPYTNGSTRLLITTKLHWQVKLYTLDSLLVAIIKVLRSATRQLPSGPSRNSPSGYALSHVFKPPTVYTHKFKYIYIYL